MGEIKVGLALLRPMCASQSELMGQFGGYRAVSFQIVPLTWTVSASVAASVAP